MTSLSGSVKSLLRTRIKKKVLPAITAESKKRQSDAIVERVIASEHFKKAERISIYLSTPTEVDTTHLLMEMFNQGKKVFVPSYDKNLMEMLKLEHMLDYDSLPLTKWKIKQPDINDERENPLTTGGIDLFLVPGVAFSRNGGRMGHGMGFYDKYFKRHSEAYPNKKPILIGLAFNEQVVHEYDLPLADHDVLLDCVVTEDDIFLSK